MGQSSSTISRTAIPTTNLIIDASDSYVTDLKLRNTAVVPISAYIKKDKYNKNIQRLTQVKKSPSQEKTNKSKEKDAKIYNMERKAQIENIHQEKKQRNMEEIKNKKQQFIESSYEDIPDNRKWVNGLPQYFQSNKEPRLKNRKTQTKIHKSYKKIMPEIEDSCSQDSKEIRTKSTQEILQIYKNYVYPHIYKNRYIQRSEKLNKEHKRIRQKQAKQNITEQKKETQRKDEQKPDGKFEKIKEPIPVNKSDRLKRPNKNEESTHQLTKHHFKAISQFFKKPKRNNLVVQTNVACVIHPYKIQKSFSYSNEEIVKNPKTSGTKKCTSKFFEERNTVKSVSNLSTIIIQRKVDKIDQATDQHRKSLSPKQALANWKNIHTLKQHRKISQSYYQTYPEELHRVNHENFEKYPKEIRKVNQPNYETYAEEIRKANQRNYEKYPEEILMPKQPSYEKYPEKNSKINNRNSYTEDRYNIEYNPQKNSYSQMEYIVHPRKNRSRAGYIDISRSAIVKTERKMTPLELSNYNYSKISPVAKMKDSSYEIQEQNQRVKFQVPRENGNFERPGSPHYEYIDNSAYDRCPQQVRYQNYEASRYPDNQINEIKPSMLSNHDYYRNIPMPEKEEKEKRIIDREDFIADMERCLQNHQKMASIFARTPSPNRTSWVQDKYRRWHKIVRNNCE